MMFKIWYKWLESKLAPSDKVVTWILIAIATVTLVIALQKSTTLKAAWAAYMLSP